MILQAVVDHSYRFIDINVGWPGSVQDARVFAHSALYEKIMEKNLLSHTPMSAGGVNVPLYLIGDCLPTSNLAHETFYTWKCFNI